MKEVLSSYPNQKSFKYGLIRGTYTDDLFFIGIYSGQTFDGTDRLSMAAQPDFLKMISDWNMGGKTIVLEGDRLFTASCIENIPDKQIFILTASEAIKEERHAERRDSQSAQFKQGRKTKVARIAAANNYTELPNNSKEEFTFAVQALKNAINVSRETLNRRSK